MAPKFELKTNYDTKTLTKVIFDTETLPKVYLWYRNSNESLFMISKLFRKFIYDIETNESEKLQKFSTCKEVIIIIFINEDIYIALN